MSYSTYFKHAQESALHLHDIKNPIKQNHKSKNKNIDVHIKICTRHMKRHPLLRFDMGKNGRRKEHTTTIGKSAKDYFTGISYQDSSCKKNKKRKEHRTKYFLRNKELKLSTDCKLKWALYG